MTVDELQQKLTDMMIQFQKDYGDSFRFIGNAKSLNLKQFMEALQFNLKKMSDIDGDCGVLDLLYLMTLEKFVFRVKYDLFRCEDFSLDELDRLASIGVDYREFIAPVSAKPFNISVWNPSLHASETIWSQVKVILHQAILTNLSHTLVMFPQQFLQLAKNLDIASDQEIASWSDLDTDDESNECFREKFAWTNENRDTPLALAFIKSKMSTETSNIQYLPVPQNREFQYVLNSGAASIQCHLDGLILKHERCQVLEEGGPEQNIQKRVLVGVELCRSQASKAKTESCQPAVELLCLNNVSSSPALVFSTDLNSTYQLLFLVKHDDRLEIVDVQGISAKMAFSFVSSWVNKDPKSFHQKILNANRLIASLSSDTLTKMADTTLNTEAVLKDDLVKKFESIGYIRKDIEDAFLSAKFGATI